MFTGLIQEVGTVVSVKQNPEGVEMIISAPELIHSIKPDDSVATNGVCLTATQICGDSFTVQAVSVTLEKTSIGALRPMDKVNLELSLKPTDRLGGHFVQGHVSGMGKITDIHSTGKHWLINVEFSPELRKYMILEGSIALDGISLTIAELGSDHLTVAIIPHTLEKTSLSTKKIGDLLNIEVDMMAKYIENFLTLGKDHPRSKEWIENLKN